MQNVIMLEDGWAKLKTGGVQKIEEILEDMKDGVYRNKISTDEFSRKLHKQLSLTAENEVAIDKLLKEDGDRKKA